MAGAVVAAVPEVVVGAEVLNRPPRGAVAGVVDGAAVDVALPAEGKKGF